MKTFFRVLLILEIVLLVLAAGMIALLQYRSIKPNDKAAAFIAGWGVTLMPYYGSDVQYPMGDVMLIRKVSAADVQSGDVVLYANGASGFMAGQARERTEQGLTVTGAGDTVNAVADVSVAGVYRLRMPGFGTLLGTLRSPLSIGISAAALLLTLLLWRLLPAGKAEDAVLSRSDGDIASNLY